MNIKHIRPETGHPINRRRMLQFALAGTSALLIPLRGHAQSSLGIEAVRNYIGQAQPSHDELVLTLPLVAEDGSAVPLTIESSQHANGPTIERLAIFAPGNPTPEVAEFRFGPNIDTLKLSTRIRLSESQTVIAVAHTDNGKVLVAERAVRVTTSGCIAPAQADLANEMKARVRLPKSWKRGEAGEVLTMITHPMTTGLTQDTSGAIVPQRIIKTFTATLGQEPVITATYHRSLSINPYLRFDMKPQQGGDMRFEWTEDTGRTVAHQETIQLSGA